MQTTSRITERHARPLSLRPGGGFGLWRATVRTCDGREFEGGGLSEREALHRAELKARLGGAACQ